MTPDGGSDRPVALDRHTAAGTDLRVIIPQRHVLNTAIVPECDGVGPPAKPHLEFRPGAALTGPWLLMEPWMKGLVLLAAVGFTLVAA
jgi:hypothetical protein